MATWDPQQYERFADLRTRPFRDLLARVPLEAPHLVLDLGCGNGIATLLAADRWPGAHIVGVDNSEQMLARAAERDTADRVQWELGNIATMDISAHGTPDVILTNATLQWIPEHLELIPAWLRALAPGGVFAMQVPGNFDQASHRIIRDVVRAEPRVNELTGVLRDDPVHSPLEYAEVLGAGCASMDVWETTYLQMLDPHAEQAHPVLEWVKGTALRPVLDAMDPGEQVRFLDRLGARLDAAYPRAEFGVPFPFRRIFAVASTPTP